MKCQHVDQLPVYAASQLVCRAYLWPATMRFGVCRTNAVRKHACSCSSALAPAACSMLDYTIHNRL